MSCDLAMRLAPSLNRRTYHQNFTFRAMGAVGAAHGGNRMVCQPRPPLARAWSDHQCLGGRTVGPDFVPGNPGTLL
jgi:hypothetical protein